jgi:pilus assembly protein CpaE
MRAGIREFLAPPFNRQGVLELTARLRDTAEKKPPSVESTDMVFSFLPSKAGVGASTIALNTACALSRVPKTNVLLADFDLNCGMQRFMLRLDHAYSLVDAVEHAARMDENLWPQLVASMGSLDVLHSGRMNPDFRVEPAQIRHLIEFVRRNYRAACIDLSGNMEKYSIEACTNPNGSSWSARRRYRLFIWRARSTLTSRASTWAAGSASCSTGRISVASSPRSR